ncbi:hypothetical protein [Ramlibacter sp. Leaf400]|uniref:hypothetical protein n=1 Tax=Ramlibacter sp. Leaf400 TaxID=1736365 RepID=UPI0006FC0BD1|nr:hypothetical protein [Ramlibacter sp. Leaf400]KQT13471.1 hypothetical protein ASG30_18765 [Ramlibacter sp. Leaf400]
MTPPASPETKLLRNLVRLHGRDPRGFEAERLPNGRVRVMAPCGAAFYPYEGWTSSFVRHLHQGFFDSRHPTTLSDPGRCGSGEGGTG